MRVLLNWASDSVNPHVLSVIACRTVFNVVITFEERVMDQVIEGEAGAGCRGL